MLNAEHKGRWWIVGSALIDTGSNTIDQVKSTNNDVDAHSSSSHGHVDPSLLQLAKRCQMNTELRRVIFCQIMGAEVSEVCYQHLIRSTRIS